MGYPSKRLTQGAPALVAGLLFLVSGAIPASGAEGGRAGLLDGEAFVVERGEKGAKAEGKDTYLFLDGTFRSTHHERNYGFREGAYTATSQGDAVTFTSDLASGSEGKIHWEGTVRDGRVEARYTWTGRKSKWYRSTPRATEHWARSVTSWATEDPGPPGGEPPSHVLDGKTFRVRTGEQGKEAVHHNDYLVFRNGRFVSTDCVDPLEFRQSTYSATSMPDGIRFRAETPSPGHGTMIWDGTVRGKVVEATARWIDKRWYWTIDRSYWFKGNLLE